MSASNFILALLTLCTVKQTANQRPTLNFLSLLPYPDPEDQPSWTEGPTLILAEQLAVDLLNNRTDILPDHTVKLIQGDSGCNIRRKATLTFVEDLLYNVENVAGIVGPGCSTSAITVSPLSGNSDIALINVHGAGSLLLEDRAAYPYAFGTLDSTKAFARAAQKLIDKNEWNLIGALYDPNRVYYSTTLHYFQQLVECEEHFECSTNHIYAVQEFNIPLELLRDGYIRTIFLFVGPDFLRKILCLAFHSGMLPPTYHWIIISRVVEEITDVTFNISKTEYTCTDEDMQTMANGSLILHYSLQPLDPYKIQDPGISFSQFASLYEARVLEYNSTSNPIEPSFWSTAYFDATWALALALNDSRDEVREKTGLDLADYRYGDRNATEIIREHLLQLDFNGVSGRITFRDNTGYVPRLIDVYTVNNSEMTIVAYYDSIQDSIVITDKEHTFVNSTYRQVLINVSIHLALGTIYCLITFIELVLIVVFHILTLFWRKHKPIKASSPKLSHFAFTGCYILVIGAFSYIAAETFSGSIDSQTKCNLYYVTYFASSTGGTLIFGTVCAHIWRLYRIYVHYLRPGRFITEKILMTFIVVVFLFSLFLCLLWVGFDRLSPTLIRTQEITEVQQNDGISLFDIKVFLEYRCLSLESFNWLIPQIVFNLLVMGLALALAIMTRRIPHKDFKTRRIILLVYMLSGVLVLGFGTSYILQASNTAITAQFVVLSTVHCLVIFLTAVFLLLPPVCSVIQELRSNHKTSRAVLKTEQSLVFL